MNKSDIKKEKTISIRVSDYTLTDRQRSDLELLMNGGFAPLKTFNNKEDYNSILEDMRLRDGTLWPIPVTLDLSSDYIRNNNI